MLQSNMGFGVTRRGGKHAEEVHVLSTLLVLLLVSWLLGVVGSSTAGGFIHVLPAAVILVRADAGHPDAVFARRG